MRIIGLLVSPVVCSSCLAEHASGAGAAVLPLRVKTYFCSVSVDSSCELPLKLRRFFDSLSPAHRSALAHPDFAPLRSIFRSAHFLHTCSEALFTPVVLPSGEMKMIYVICLSKIADTGTLRKLSDRASESSALPATVLVSTKMNNNP